MEQSAKGKEEAEKKRQDFLEMKYCLPEEEAVPLASRIISIYGIA